jgi:Na+/proline symporter
MSAAKLRITLIAILVVAAVLSVVGKKSGSAVTGWLSFVAFLGGVAVYVTWRRAVASERRDTVFDREAKTDETRAGSDQ